LLGHRVPLRAGFVAAALGVSLFAIPASAQASPANVKIVDTSATIDAGTINLFTKSGGGLSALASSADPVHTRLRQRIDKHLADQALAGHYLDYSQVKAASIPNPLEPGKNVDLVWSGSSNPSALHLNKRRIGKKAGQTGVSVVFNPRENATRKGPSGGSATASVGSGFEGATEHPNMYSEGNDCYTVWFNPTYSSVNDNDHQMNTCWEIWAQDKTVHFIYNRWALWTLARPSSSVIEANTVDFSILSRPWNTRAGDIAKINKSTPSAGSATCSDVASIKIGGAYAGLTGEINIPVHKCERTWVHFDAGRKQFGLDWDGSSPYQLRLDAAGDYDAVNKTVLPVWADQTFVAVSWCDWNNWCAVHYPENWKYQDRGW
jgi:hypothetical protein